MSVEKIIEWTDGAACLVVLQFLLRPLKMFILIDEKEYQILILIDEKKYLT